MLKSSKLLFISTAMLALTACNPSEAQVQKTEDSHADHKHDEAPKMAVQSKAALGVPSGSYTMDKTHGYVTFSYLHKGLSRPQLRFNDVDASLVLDAKNPENSQVNVTINPASIDSGVAKFDVHLNSADFFNSTVNKTIGFKSTGFTRTNETSGTMSGELTMMGVTKIIDFDVTLIGIADGDTPTIGVEGRTTLKRSDFSLGKYVPYVGDEVSITVSAEFNKDK